MQITSLEILEKERVYKEILQDIKIKQEEFLSISSEVDGKKSEQGQLTKDIEQKKNTILILDKTIQEKQNIDTIIQNKLDNAQKEFGITDRLSSKIKKRLLVQSEKIKTNKILVESSNVLTLQVQKDSSKEKEKLDLLLKEYLLLKKSYDDLKDNVSILQTQKNNLLKEQEEINQAIDIAFIKFRLFEKRIHQFSQDTGYMVGYKIPTRKKLIVNT